MKFRAPAIPVVAGVCAMPRKPRSRVLSTCLQAALLAPLYCSVPVLAVEVKNCDDSGPDSLRDVVQNKAVPGDVVDLTQLPALCGMANSTITLTSGEITVAQDDLTLTGPLDGTVKISGGHSSRVFHHTGAGTLSLNSLALSDGYYHTAGDAYGGCVNTDFGDLSLNRVVVDGCAVASDMGYANGGGVSSKLGNVTLILSTVSNNQANAPVVRGFGGGVYSGSATTAKYSTILANTTHDGPMAFGVGGGIAARGGAAIVESTVAENATELGSGISVAGGPTAIINSTFSGNTAYNGCIYIFGVDSATIANSTIALNHDDGTAQAGAVIFKGLSAASTLTLQSSILADNTSGSGNAASDLYLWSGAGVLAGADNLVNASNVASPPAGVITITAEPKLGPLQFNGGHTTTHALLAGSPALGMGNNNAMVNFDQRGAGYPRSSGPGGNVDIGAFQFDSIFADGVDFQ